MTVYNLYFPPVSIYSCFLSLSIDLLSNTLKHPEVQIKLHFFMYTCPLPDALLSFIYMFYFYNSRVSSYELRTEPEYKDS
jgi:hypothetical protein